MSRLKITRETPKKQPPIQLVELVCRELPRDSIQLRKTGNSFYLTLSGNIDDPTIVIDKSDLIEFANTLLEFAKQESK